MPTLKEIRAKLAPRPKKPDPMDAQKCGPSCEHWSQSGQEPWAGVEWCRKAQNPILDSRSKRFCSDWEHNPQGLAVFWSGSTI